MVLSFVLNSVASQACDINVVRLMICHLQCTEKYGRFVKVLGLCSSHMASESVYPNAQAGTLRKKNDAFLFLVRSHSCFRAVTSLVNRAC